MYGSALLPATYQGTRTNVTEGQEPLEDICNSRMGVNAQRRQLDYVQELNRDMLERTEAVSQIEGVIQSYELAFRMQRAMPTTLELSREPEGIREIYGLNADETRTFGTQCLPARRMAEQRVRFIERGLRGWDRHNNLRKRLAANALAVDKPIAALLADLKHRGMLEETLIVRNCSPRGLARQV